MSGGWQVICALAIGTYALKSAGPLVLGGRKLPLALERAALLIPAALLAALTATSTFSDGETLVLDARAVGLAAAIVALLLRAPFVVVVVVAALAAAAARAVS